MDPSVTVLLLSVRSSQKPILVHRSLISVRSGSISRNEFGKRNPCLLPLLLIFSQQAAHWLTTHPHTIYIFLKKIFFEKTETLENFWKNILERFFTVHKMKREAFSSSKILETQQISQQPLTETCTKTLLWTITNRRREHRDASFIDASSGRTIAAENQAEEDLKTTSDSDACCSCAEVLCSLVSCRKVSEVVVASGDGKAKPAASFVTASQFASNLFKH